MFQWPECVCVNKRHTARTSRSVNLPALKDGASETSNRSYLPSKLSRKVHFCDLSVRTLTLFVERSVATPEGEASTHLKVLGRLAFVRFVPRGSVHCHCSRSRCGHKVPGQNDATSWRTMSAANSEVPAVYM